MLQSIWKLLENYEFDVNEVADAITKLLEKLAPLMDVPVVGELLTALQSFAPVIEDVTEAAV